SPFYTVSPLTLDFGTAPGFAKGSAGDVVFFPFFGKGTRLYVVRPRTKSSSESPGSFVPVAGFTLPEIEATSHYCVPVPGVAEGQERGAGVVAPRRKWCTSQ